MVNLDYLYNPDAAKTYFGKNNFVDKKLGFSVIENGIILPKIDGKTGGIVDSNGEFIKGSYIHMGVGGAYTPRGIN